MKKKTFSSIAWLVLAVIYVIFGTYYSHEISKLKVENLQLKCYAPTCDNKALEVERQRNKNLRRLVLAQDNTINMLKGESK